MTCNNSITFANVLQERNSNTWIQSAPMLEAHNPKVWSLKAWQCFILKTKTKKRGWSSLGGTIDCLVCEEIIITCEAGWGLWLQIGCPRFAFKIFNFALLRWIFWWTVLWISSWKRGGNPTTTTVSCILWRLPLLGLHCQRTDPKEFAAY